RRGRASRPDRPPRTGRPGNRHQGRRSGTDRIAPRFASTAPAPRAWPRDPGAEGQGRAASRGADVARLAPGGPAAVRVGGGVAPPADGGLGRGAGAGTARRGMVAATTSGTRRAATTVATPRRRRLIPIVTRAIASKAAAATIPSVRRTPPGVGFAGRGIG